MGSQYFLYADITDLRGGAVVEWLKKLCYGAESCQEVVRLRPDFAIK